MTCPECGSENRDTAERCGSCRNALALPAHTVLADRYEIDSLIGVGGLGRVYRAHDLMLDEIVAVKVLHPEAARSQELSRRFRSEIKLARKVRHRNVCAIHEYGEHEDHRFVAMELVDGVDLHRVLQERGPLPPEDAFEVCIQVAKGLSAIHEAGVIHRDLKTPNIMRDGQGVVRLLDFGIAKLIRPTGTLAVTAVQKVVGTPEYMSPEQIRGDDLDQRSDIYALGVVIYELFTGVVPFQGKSPLDTLVKHLNTPPPLYGDAAARLPQGLLPILRRCLAKDPKDRYSSAHELLEALRMALRVAFPKAVPTPQSMASVDPASAAIAPVPPVHTSVLPKPSVRGSRPAPPPPLAAKAPLPAIPHVPIAPGPPPARSNPRPSAERPATLPPAGPPQRPQPGAPPLRKTAREAAQDSALDRSETFVELPQAAPLAPSPLVPPPLVTPSEKPTTPQPPPAAAGKRLRGSWLVRLTLLGALGFLGAWWWQLRDHTAGAGSSRATAANAPAGGRVAAPPAVIEQGSAESPAPPPSPPTEAEEPSSAAAVETDPAVTPSPRPRRRAAPSPTPEPTAQPTPEPTPLPTTGMLSLSVKPDSSVEVDGQAKGQAPLADLELDAGSHVLRLTHPDYWPLQRRVAIEAGNADRLAIDLAWEGVPRGRAKEPPYRVPLDGSPNDDAYFMRGLRQLADGDFQEAILTLEPVARRLGQAGKEKELARAEFYLGVALLELNRESDAKERFERALEQDGSVKVPATGFSAKVVSVFNGVRDARRKQ